MVIAQESAQSLARLNRPVAANVRTPREQQNIALPLMIPLSMDRIAFKFGLRAGSASGSTRPDAMIARKDWVYLVSRSVLGSHRIPPWLRSGQFAASTARPNGNAGDVHPTALEMVIASKNRSQRHPARLRQEWTT